MGVHSAMALLLVVLTVIKLGMLTDSLSDM